MNEKQTTEDTSRPQKRNGGRTGGALAKPAKTEPVSRGGRSGESGDDQEAMRKENAEAALRKTARADGLQSGPEQKATCVHDEPSHSQSPLERQWNQRQHPRHVTRFYRLDRFCGNPAYLMGKRCGKCRSRPPDAQKILRKTCRICSANGTGFPLLGENTKKRLRKRFRNLFIFYGGPTRT